MSGLRWWFQGGGANEINEADVESDFASLDENFDEDDDDDDKETRTISDVSGSAAHGTNTPPRLGDRNRNRRRPTASATTSRIRLSPAATDGAALRRRIGELEAAEARAAAGEGAAWDIRDAGSGGSDDAALVASGVARACRVRGGGLGLLTPAARSTLVGLLCELLPTRPPAAVDVQISFVLAARSRQAQRLSVTKAWRALGGSAPPVSSSSLLSHANPNDASFASGGSSAPAAAWSGPDGLARIAAAEWRAAKRADAEDAKGIALAAAAASTSALTRARERRNDDARVALAEWRATGGLRGVKAAEPPTPPRLVEAVDNVLLRAHAEVAIERAAAKRDAVAAANIAAAAAAVLRANGGVAPMMVLGERAVAAREIGMTFGTAALPERSTVASERAAMSAREAAARGEARRSAAAHAGVVASVRESAGRSFGVGSAGARPSRATPTWRKGL